MKAYHRKLDAHHVEIMHALREAGATVQDLSEVGGGCPDLMAGKHSVTYLLEVKGPKEKPNPKQEHWHNRWNGRPVAIVRTVEEALVVIGALPV